MLISNVNINYENEVIYKDFNIEFEENKINCIIGKSGCGKTTLLNFIANDLVSKGIKVAYVFQNYNLIPWENVYNNLKFIGKQYFSSNMLDNEINRILELVDLKEFKYYYPDELSGGMKQRVNLGRALLGNFNVLLLDEPFRSLDIKCKNRIMKIINDINKKNNVTIILVTHNKDEMLCLADNIFLLGDKPVSIIDRGNREKFKSIINKII